MVCGTRGNRHLLWVGLENVWRLSPGADSSQPPAAFAAYSRTGADGPWAAHSIHVLAPEQDKISALTLFPKPAGPPLFRAFGLPLVLPHGGSAEFVATRSAASPEPVSTASARSRLSLTGDPW